MDVETITEGVETPLSLGDGEWTLKQLSKGQTVPTINQLSLTTAMSPFQLVLQYESWESANSSGVWDLGVPGGLAS